MSEQADKSRALTESEESDIRECCRIMAKHEDRIKRRLNARAVPVFRFDQVYRAIESILDE